jgi:hypothetical protein
VYAVGIGISLKRMGVAHYQHASGRRCYVSSGGGDMTSTTHAQPKTRPDGLLGPNAMAPFVGDAVASPFRVYQGLIQENMRFWARRLHAYADWILATSASASAEEIMAAQKTFLAQTQQDYTRQGTVLAEIMTSAASAATSDDAAGMAGLDWSWNQRPDSSRRKSDAKRQEA